MDEGTGGEKDVLIEEFILAGRENSKSQSDIARVANIPERSVRHEVNLARIKRGMLIIGDESGYYFPSDISDIIAYVKRRKASIRTSKQALAPFIKALRR